MVAVVVVAAVAAVGSCGSSGSGWRYSGCNSTGGGRAAGWMWRMVSECYGWDKGSCMDQQVGRQTSRQQAGKQLCRFRNW